MTDPDGHGAGAQQPVGEGRRLSHPDEILEMQGARALAGGPGSTWTYVAELIIAAAGLRPLSETAIAAIRAMAAIADLEAEHGEGGLTCRACRIRPPMG